MGWKERLDSSQKSYQKSSPSSLKGAGNNSRDNPLKGVLKKSTRNGGIQRFDEADRLVTMVDGSDADDHSEWETVFSKRAKISKSKYIAKGKGCMLNELDELIMPEIAVRNKWTILNNITETNEGRDESGEDDIDVLRKMEEKEKLVSFNRTVSVAKIVKGKGCKVKGYGQTRIKDDDFGKDIRQKARRNDQLLDETCLEYFWDYNEIGVFTDKDKMDSQLLAGMLKCEPCEIFFQDEETRDLHLQLHRESAVEDLGGLGIIVFDQETNRFVALDQTFDPRETSTQAMLGEEKEESGEAKKKAKTGRTGKISKSKVAARPGKVPTTKPVKIKTAPATKVTKTAARPEVGAAATPTRSGMEPKVRTPTPRRVLTPRRQVPIKVKREEIGRREKPVISNDTVVAMEEMNETEFELEEDVERPVKMAKKVEESRDMFEESQKAEDDDETEAGEQGDDDDDEEEDERDVSLNLLDEKAERMRTNKMKAERVRKERKAEAEKMAAMKEREKRERENALRLREAMRNKSNKKAGPDPAMKKAIKRLQATGYSYKDAQESNMEKKRERVKGLDTKTMLQRSGSKLVKKASQKTELIVPKFPSVADLPRIPKTTVSGVQPKKATGVQSVQGRRDRSAAATTVQGKVGRTAAADSWAAVAGRRKAVTQRGETGGMSRGVRGSVSAGSSYSKLPGVRRLQERRTMSTADVSHEITQVSDGYKAVVPEQGNKSDHIYEWKDSTLVGDNEVQEDEMVQLGQGNLTGGEQPPIGLQSSNGYPLDEEMGTEEEERLLDKLSREEFKSMNLATLVKQRDEYIAELQSQLDESKSNGMQDATEVESLLLEVADLKRQKLEKQKIFQMYCPNVPLEQQGEVSDGYKVMCSDDVTNVPIAQFLREMDHKMKSLEQDNANLRTQLSQAKQSLETISNANVMTAETNQKLNQRIEALERLEKKLMAKIPCPAGHNCPGAEVCGYNHELTYAKAATLKGNKVSDGYKVRDGSKRSISKAKPCQWFWVDGEVCKFTAEDCKFSHQLPADEGLQTEYLKEIERLEKVVASRSGSKAGRSGEKAKSGGKKNGSDGSGGAGSTPMSAAEQLAALRRGSSVFTKQTVMSPASKRKRDDEMVSNGASPMEGVSPIGGASKVAEILRQQQLQRQTAAGSAGSGESDINSWLYAVDFDKIFKGIAGLMERFSGNGGGAPQVGMETPTLMSQAAKVKAATRDFTSDHYQGQLGLMNPSPVNPPVRSIQPVVAQVPVVAQPQGGAVDQQQKMMLFTQHVSSSMNEFNKLMESKMDSFLKNL